jgi:hypothetical protein
MTPRLVHRRRDGLVEIRRARARDLVLTSDAAMLLALLAGWFLLVAILVMSLLFDPPFLAFPAWLVLVFAVEQRRARRPRRVRSPVAPARPSAS